MNRICVSIALLAVFTALGSAEIRVPTPDGLRAAVKRPQPDYNPMAKQMKVQGDVEVDVKITPEGGVEDVQVVSGNPMLSAPVVKTLKDWKFTPFQQDGKATPAVSRFRFSFKL
jgi:TonB family protein